MLEPPLLGRLLDAGLLLLLRFALDDTAEPVLTAALAAMEALLDSRPDEVGLMDGGGRGGRWKLESMCKAGTKFRVLLMR